MDNHTFSQDNQTNNKLTPINDKLNLSISDVRNIALLKYGSVAGFGRSLGITHGLASRLLSGDYVPLKPETIQRISDSLGINPITLTQIYSDCKNQTLKKSEECGNKQVPCDSNSTNKSGSSS